MESIRVKAQPTLPSFRRTSDQSSMATGRGSFALDFDLDVDGDGSASAAATDLLLGKESACQFCGTPGGEGGGGAGSLFPFACLSLRDLRGARGLTSRMGASVEDEGP